MNFRLGLGSRLRLRFQQRGHRRHRGRRLLLGNKRLNEGILILPALGRRRRPFRNCRRRRRHRVSLRRRRFRNGLGSRRHRVITFRKYASLRNRRLGGRSRRQQRIAIGIYILIDTDTDRLGGLLLPLLQKRRLLRRPHRLQRLPLLHILNVQTPTRQPRRQPRILPVPPDRQRHLRLRHHHIRRPLLRIQLHPPHIRRTQRPRNQRTGIGIPLNHINLLPLQLVHDALNPVPPQPNARTHRIHTILPRKHRHLAPHPRIPRHRPNLHRPVPNLRHLRLHQPPQQIPMRPTHHHLRPPRRLRHLHQQHLNILPLPIPLIPHLILGPHHPPRPLILRLVRIQIDVHRPPPPLHAVHAPADDLPLIRRILVKNLLPLRLPQPLDEHLPRRLRRNPAVVVSHPVQRNLRPNLRTRRQPPRLRQPHLRLLVLHLLHHRHQRVDADLPRVRIQLHRQVLRPRHAVPPKRRRQGNLHLPQHQILPQPPLGG